MSDFPARLPLFADRRDAGRLLARGLESERGADAVVVGLARGGVVVAAEVADSLGLPLDVVAVRKVGHPWQPEYAIGAVTPGDGVYVRSADGLTEDEVRAAVEAAKARAVALDARLHEDADSFELDGRTCILVDDGLATGATMLAALRWARARGAKRTIAAVPVAPHSTVALIASEADAVVCLHEPDPFSSVGLWYGSFDQVEDGEVKRLLAASAARAAAGRA